jgi:nitrogen regulatory protein PII 2
MKEIMAIIRINKINSTKKALAEAGIGSMHAKESLGRGRGLVDLSVLQGAEKGYEEAIAQLGSSQRLIPKRLISLIVPDKLADLVIQTIITANKTGKPGDGKIFVLPVSQAIRIRTGEVGDAVLDAA